MARPFEEPEIGTRFGNLTLMKETWIVPADKVGGAISNRWAEVQCDCGAILVLLYHSMKSGNSNGCRACWLKKWGHCSSIVRSRKNIKARRKYVLGKMHEKDRDMATIGIHTRRYKVGVKHARMMKSLVGDYVDNFLVLGTADDIKLFYFILEETRGQEGREEFLNKFRNQEFPWIGKKRYHELWICVDEEEFRKFYGKELDLYLSAVVL